MVTSPLCGDAVEILSHSLSLPLRHMDFRFSFQNLTICFRCLSPNLALLCLILWMNSSTKLRISLSSIVLKCTAIKKRGIYVSTLAYRSVLHVQCNLTNQSKALFSLSQSRSTKLNHLSRAFHRLRAFYRLHISLRFIPPRRFPAFLDPYKFSVLSTG